LVVMSRDGHLLHTVARDHSVVVAMSEPVQKMLLRRYRQISCKAAVRWGTVMIVVVMLLLFCIDYGRVDPEGAVENDHTRRESTLENAARFAAAENQVGGVTVSEKVEVSDQAINARWAEAEATASRVKIADLEERLTKQTNSLARLQEWAQTLRKSVEENEAQLKDSQAALKESQTALKESKAQLAVASATQAEVKAPVSATLIVPGETAGKDRAEPVTARNVKSTGAVSAIDYQSLWSAMHCTNASLAQRLNSRERASTTRIDELLGPPGIMVPYEILVDLGSG
jgi:hypothetical protein